MVCNNFNRNRFKCYFTSEDRSLVAQANCHGGRCATQKETLSVLMNSCFFILWQSQIIIYLLNLFLLSLISLRNLRCIIPGFSNSNKLNFIDKTTTKKVWNLIAVRHLPKSNTSSYEYHGDYNALAHTEWRWGGYRTFSSFE